METASTSTAKSKVRNLFRAVCSKVSEGGIKLSVPLLTVGDSYFEVTMKMHGYNVVFEHVSEGNWGAYAPDLPGLGVGGSSKEEVEQKIQEGIVIHLQGLKEDGLPIPTPNYTD
jgi:predicted RNase H-like HicB family nuclease